LKNGWRKNVEKIIEIEIVSLRMFVRKKKNRSGTVSVVIVSKQSGTYREVRSIGTSSDASEVAEYVHQGNDWIRQQNALPDMFDNYEREQSEREAVDFFSTILKIFC
jgi:hypothetical protein